MIVTLGDGRQFETGEPFDISIPLRFNGPQANAYGVAPAASAACEYGDLIGDTRRGGSCNFERVTLIPHCNGTHTECVGHITNERISIRECLRDPLVLATLVSVEPERALQCNEHYAVEFGAEDRVMTRRMLEARYTASRNSGALVVRTIPNDDSKLTNRYNENNIPPYFTTEAMEFMAEKEIKHLLCDIPSVDRLFDQGKLSNHRIFWRIPQGGYSIDEKTRRNSTITEMIYVPNEIEDGEYLLNLQIAPFESDASPSRPLLFKIRNS